MFILCMGMGAAIYHLVKIDVTIQTIVDCQVKLTHSGSVLSINQQSYMHIFNIIYYI